jgi:hypothetical protein
MPNLKRPAVLFFSFLLGLTATACSSKISISETISGYSEKALLTEKRITEKKSYPESLDLLKESAAVFSIFIAPEIPAEAAESLHRLIGQKLESTGLYAKILPDEMLNTLLTQKNDLTQAKDIYLDTLAVVSVSDKDISNPLGDYLQVKNFLIFQVDRWPCTGCDQNNGLRMKLRVVDVASGYIVWTGIAEKKEAQGILANLEAGAAQMVEELADSFFHRFKQKWHRQRFDNLLKATG